MSFSDLNFKLVIDGKKVDGRDVIPVVNPATGLDFATSPRADADQLDDAVSAARRAFRSWSRLAADERRAAILQLADALEARFEVLVDLLVAEQGKLVAEARYEVRGAIGLLRGFTTFDGSSAATTLVKDETTHIVSHRTPLGVVAVITPWNFPLMLLASKLGPALLTGNTVVAKPAPTTPLTSLLVGEIAGTVLPAGVLNIIVDDNDLGDLLTGHPDVAKVAFTGSTATGKRVYQTAASTIKRVTLELGGNDAALILDDADPQAAAAAIFASATMNAGQVCVAAKRVYAPERLYDAVSDALAALASKAVIGAGHLPDTKIGPVQNIRQYERLRDLLADTASAGRVIAGGRIADRSGYFVEPTIVRDIADNSRLVQEEQFGPILPVLSYRDLDDVIERINRTEFGLAGSVWTRNPEAAIEIAKRVDSGTVWINKFMDLRLDVPFGGAKLSGLGAELGLEGVNEYTQLKVVNAALSAS